MLSTAAQMIGETTAFSTRYGLLVPSTPCTSLAVDGQTAMHGDHAEESAQVLPDAKYVLVAGTSVLVRSGTAQQPAKLLWHDVAALRTAGVELADDHFVIHGVDD